MSKFVLSFVLGTMLITALCAAGALIFVKVFRIQSPLGRFLIFLAPLIAAFVDRVKLFPGNTIPVLVACFTIALALLGRDFYKYLVFRKRIKTDASPSAELQAVVNDLAKSFNMRPPQALVMKSQVICPLSAGLKKPFLIVPEVMIAVLNKEEVRLLLAHEMAHIWRRDILWKWLLVFLRYLSFLNPVAELPYRWVNLEIERASDQLAISVTRKPGTLARTLLKVEKCMSQLALPVEGNLPAAVSMASTCLPARIRSMRSSQGDESMWMTLGKVGVVFYIFNLICFISVKTWLLFFS